MEDTGEGSGCVDSGVAAGMSRIKVELQLGLSPVATAVLRLNLFATGDTFSLF